MEGLDGPGGGVGHGAAPTAGGCVMSPDTPAMAMAKHSVSDVIKSRREVISQLMGHRPNQPVGGTGFRAGFTLLATRRQVNSNVWNSLAPLYVGASCRS